VPPTTDALITVDTNPARSPANRIAGRSPSAREEANHQKAPSMDRIPGNLGPPTAAPLEYAFTMAMITVDAMGESAPINTGEAFNAKARNASKAPAKPVAMSSL
jgi:hypothetical protein